MILCFGLIRPYKGVDLLLEAFRAVRGGRALGRRPAARGVARWAAGARRAGSGTGALRPRFVSDRELPAYFHRADLVVLPHRDAEQSGVLYVALAFGKPIVMSAVGGFPEVAAHGAGRLVPAADREALATALNELLDDPDARERARGRRARGGRRALLLGRRRRADAGPLPGPGRMTVVAVAFWVSVGLLVYTHLGYPALLWLLTRSRRPGGSGGRAERSTAQRVADRRCAR